MVEGLWGPSLVVHVPVPVPPGLPAVSSLPNSRRFPNFRPAPARLPTRNPENIPISSQPSRPGRGQGISALPTEFYPLLAYVGLALFVGVAGLAVSTFLGPRRLWSKAKYEPYECGVDQVQNPHRPFAIKFYVFALLFILFDIETIFLLPFAAGFQTLIGSGAFQAVLVFMAVLGLGLAYILRSGALDWE
jgi:NADH-quinone oxidoreductase subunit A